MTILPMLIPLSHTHKMTMMIISISSLMLLMAMLNSPLITLSPWLSMDSTSLALITLTLFTHIMISSASNSFMSTNKFTLPILVFLMLAFSMSDLLSFYIMFELTLIPTFILVMKEGKQQERTQASMYLLLYTFLASLPLLIAISFIPPYLSMPLMTSNMVNLLHPTMFLLAFLTKLPMFFLHLWLPKAHVEAPMEGSMVLAAILLKLGGYGMIRILPLSFKSLHYMSPWLMSISTLGAIFTSFTCTRQKDLKAMIAYSSVAHMSLVITSLSASKTLSTTSSTLMMLGHGLISSALFFLVNSMYMKKHSRNLLTFKGLTTTNPKITFWLFILLITNISAPPSINIISEIMMIFSMTQWSYTIIPLFVTSSFILSAFCIILFSTSAHNTPHQTPSPANSHYKIHTTSLFHLIPLILLTMKSDIFPLSNSYTMTLTCGVKTLMILTPLMMSTSLILIIITIYTMNSQLLTTIQLPLLFSFSSPSINLLLDWMSILFLSTVIFISAMVTMFSLTYIPAHLHKRFLPVLYLFVMSMCILITSNNTLILILGWDGLGLTSFILVMYFQNASSCASSYITMMTNRLGDLAIISAIAMSPLLLMNFNNNKLMPLTSLILLTLAAFTKSAQFPFSAWLPAAMAAPTPISALVHSSTLVTAGAYLLIRVTPSSPHLHPIIASISMMTIMIAGLTAFWEQDMKKIIAMSTLSQIAMITLTISLNCPMIAFFHLITHAFFKSTLFITAGLIIHSSSYQDLRSTPSPSPNSPVTMAALNINSLTLMGLPFLSGFYSKDLIIETSMMNYWSWSMSSITIFSVTLTSLYTLRLSMMMTQLNKKTSPNTLPLSSNLIEMPLTLATPISILVGSLMSWNILPLTLIPLPLTMKISTLTTITLGLIMTLTSSLKSKTFTNLGASSLSMWLLTPMSSNPLYKTLTSGSTTSYMDNSWNENNPMMAHISLTHLNRTMSKMSLPQILMLSLMPIILATSM